MNVSLTPELEKFVQDKVKSGRYNSASELIREALRLIEERDHLHQRRLDAMDAYIQEGMDEAERGELMTPEELDADLDRLFVELEAKYPRA